LAHPIASIIRDSITGTRAFAIFNIRSTSWLSV
jgi:hypothetical protein